MDTRPVASDELERRRTARGLSHARYCKTMTNLDKSDWLDCYVTNPSVQLLQDGSVMLVSAVSHAVPLFIDLSGCVCHHWNATSQSPDPIWLRPLPPTAACPRRQR